MRSRAGTVWREPVGRVWLGHAQRPYEFESPCPGQEFALLLVIGDEEITPDEQGALSEAFVHAGCRYAMCWGHGCSSWDDSIDMVGVLEKIDGVERPFVMTTWHEDEPLEETAELFATCAAFDDWEADDFVALVLGGDERLVARTEAALRRQFDQELTDRIHRAIALRAWIGYIGFAAVGLFLVLTLRSQVLVPLLLASGAEGRLVEEGTFLIALLLYLPVSHWCFQRALKRHVSWTFPRLSD